MDTPTDERMDPLLRALAKLGEGSGFLWLVFFLTVTSVLNNGFHAISYVFLAEVPTHWCSVPELKAANWTEERIRNVSSLDSCSKYDYNYSFFGKVGFEETLKFVETHDRPKSSSCDVYSYPGDFKESIVQTWDLVCDKATYRTNTQMAQSLGKLVGASIFGVLSDKYGRKPCFVIGILLLIVSAPATAVVPWYWIYVVTRFVTGVSNIVMQNSSYTILTEIAGTRSRQWMGIAYSITYPMGMMVLSGAAYMTNNWRYLQISIGLPALLLLPHIWYMPESPRWLISQGRRKEAKRILERYYGPICEDAANMSLSSTHKMGLGNHDDDAEKDADEKTNFLQKNIKSLRILYSHFELRKRIAITYFLWIVASLSYYALALNVDNFSADRYIYVLLTGLTEIPSYLVPIPILAILGRRQAGAVLFTISGISLLSIMTISKADTTTILIVGLAGRFAMSSVYNIVILHTTELFPTVSRNSAVGTSSAMSHVGSVAAPYVADLLGAIAWWAPSTLCGCLALVASLFCLTLPETRGRPLADTAEEETVKERGFVTFSNCCKC